jgi:hypothetical protein
MKRSQDFYRTSQIFPLGLRVDSGLRKWYGMHKYMCMHLCHSWYCYRVYHSSMISVYNSDINTHNITDIIARISIIVIHLPLEGYIREESCLS